MKAKEIESMKKVTHRTSFFVAAYVILVGLVIFFQTLPLMMKELFGLVLNGKVSLPVDLMATGMVVICSAYCGLDRLAFASYSAKMESGISNIGNPASLRKVIYWTTLIFIESAILSIFYEISLPLTTIATSLISEVALYVTGNKAITFCGSLNGSIKSATAHDTYTQEEMREAELKDLNKPEDPTISSR